MYSLGSSKRHKKNYYYTDAETTWKAPRFGNDSVRMHYDDIARQEQGEKPDAAGIRLCNTLKSLLYACHRTIRPPPQKTLLIDLGSGKGGDIGKIARHFDRCVGVDISNHSLIEASKRATNTNLSFTPLLGDPAESSFPQSIGGADAVSSMFSLHYLVNTEPRARRLFSTLRLATRPGARFFGICVDWRSIQRGLGKEWCWFGDDISKEICAKNAFSQVYKFVLEGSVDLEETVVHMPTIEAIAEKEGWKLVLYENAKHYMERNAGEFNALASKMGSLNDMKLGSHLLEIYSVFEWLRTQEPQKW